MATFIPARRPAQGNITTPLTLTALQSFVGGFIDFINLPSGDVLVINEVSLLIPQPAPVNTAATSLANRPVHGDVVLCTPGEIA